jgi:hypothetical protein
VSAPEPGRKVDERVAALETGLTSVARSVESLAQSVQAGFADTRRERGELHGENQRALRALQDRLNENQRTPWATLAGWAAVVIAIVFGVGNIVAGGIQRASDAQAARIGRLEDHRIETAYLAGAQDARAEDVQRRLVELEHGTRKP